MATPQAPGRRRARKFPAPSQLALAQGRPCDFRSGNSRLCIDPCSPRALWRNLVWLYTRNSRRGADRLVDPARFAQAHHDPGALVAQGMDLSTCLAWPLPDYRGHTPYRHETRLEPRHTGLDPDDGGHHLRHYGVIAYAALPAAIARAEERQTRAEMVEGLRTVDRQLQEAAQPLDTQGAQLVGAAMAQDPFSAGLIRRLSGHDPHCATLAAIAGLRESRVATTAEATRVIGLLAKRRAQLH